MKPSNLYIERIYKDHPIACWALDDEISFVQLFTPEDQDLSEWTQTNASTVGSSFFRPIDESISNLVTASGTGSFVATLESTFTRDEIDFGPEGTAEFSLYVNHRTYIVYKYEIGVSIGGDEQFSEYEFGYNYDWHHLSHTFDIADDVTFFVRFYIYVGPVDIQVSAASLGQGAEPFSHITM